MTSRRIAVEQDPIEPGPDRPLTIWVDGEPVTGTAGQTIAGVLLGAGRRQWRTTREGGAPRGVFCGIGVCFDCLVEVNGLPRRAGLPAPGAGRRRRGRPGRGAVGHVVAGRVAARGDVVSTGMRHVVVVGAGPAGLAAARAAAGAGARVTLLDAADGLGGQYWRHLPAARPAGREHVLHHRWGTYRELSDALRAHPAVTVVESAQVWSLERPDDGVRLNVLVGEPDAVGREVLTLEPDALVLATGAHDRTLPFPGWQLPGVYSAGAAQALAKGERVAVGRRVVVAGAGPFLLPVASALLQTGATVVGVHEASRPGTLARGWLNRPWELAGAVGKAGELAGYVGELVRHRVP